VLNTAAIARLNSVLPIHVRRGYIKLVLVKVPWKALFTAPLEFLLEGLALEVSPNREFPLAAKPKKQKKGKGEEEEETDSYKARMNKALLNNAVARLKNLSIAFSAEEADGDHGTSRYTLNGLHMLIGDLTAANYRDAYHNHSPLVLN